MTVDGDRAARERRANQAALRRDLEAMLGDETAKLDTAERNVSALRKAISFVREIMDAETGGDDAGS